MPKEEEIKIPRYSFVNCNDRSGNRGGMLIGVSENIKSISQELAQENKVGQSLWNLVTNTNKKIGVGVIYAPIVILVDFSAKIGAAIEGNKTNVTKRDSYGN